MKDSIPVQCISNWGHPQVKALFLAGGKLDRMLEHCLHHTNAAQSRNLLRLKIASAVSVECE